MPEGSALGVGCMGDFSLNATTASPSSYPDAVISDGAIAYWRLGDLSGTIAKDETGNHDGTIVGGVTLNQPGALADGNPSMKFDGSTSHINIASLPVGANLTIEIWINYTVGYSSGYTAAFSNRTGPGEIFFGTHSDILYLQMPNVGFSGTKLLNDGNWHLLTLVLTPTNAYGYIDGVLEVSSTGTHASYSSPAALGYDLGSSLHIFNGYLDEGAFYPTALTPTQISSHYAARTATPAPPITPSSLYRSGLSIGEVQTMIQNRVYAVPNRRCLLFTDGNNPSILLSNDPTFALSVPLVLTNGQAFVSSGFIICGSGDINVILKP